MSNSWVPISTSLDALRFRGRVVAYQTTMSYYDGDETGAEKGARVWSDPNLATGCGPRDYFGYIDCGAPGLLRKTDDPVQFETVAARIYRLILPDTLSCTKVITAETLARQADNPKNSGTPAVLNMRAATLREMIAVRDAVANRQAKFEFNCNRFGKALNFGITGVRQVVVAGFG